MSEIKVPAMGESITEGTVSRWMVKEGDTVNQGDVLLELETDKVNIEISAEESGVLEKIIRQEGETVEIGETIGTLSAGSGGGSAPAASEPAAAEAKPASAPAPEVPAAPVAAVAPPESSDSSKRLPRLHASLLVNVGLNWIKCRAKIRLAAYTRTM